MINAASLARREPAMFIIEDAHWIDEVSESMMVEILAANRADPIACGHHLPPGVPRTAGSDG